MSAITDTAPVPATRTESGEPRRPRKSRAGLLLTIAAWVVGILFVLGVLLYLYKGFSDGENYLLNAAGLFALGIALFPMEWNCSGTCRSFTLHGLWALLAFGCIAVVAIFLSKLTLKKLPLPVGQRKTYYDRLYNVTGASMICFPVAAFLTTLIIGDNARFIFYAEWFGIWSFAAYWSIKSKELAENRAEIHALEKDPRLASDPVMQTDGSLAQA